LIIPKTNAIGGPVHEAIPILSEANKVPLAKIVRSDFSREAASTGNI